MKCELGNKQGEILKLPGWHVQHNDKATGQMSDILVQFMVVKDWSVLQNVTTDSGFTKLPIR
jgi:hypothetical protein